MKVLALGSGNIGSIAVRDMAGEMKSTDIIVADKDKSRANKVVEGINRSNVSSMQLNIEDQTELLEALKEFDLIMGFLPGALGHTLMKACVEARKNLVDVSYMAESPMRLHSEASRAGIAIVPDCGLAPGISNFLVGHAFNLLDKTNSVHIMVGGLPEKPIPPLGYVITWSPESLIDEYTRKAVIVKHGKKTEVEALTGIQETTFPKVGKLEAFYTDGLRTLSETLNGVEEMWEKTLRYPGHAEKIGLLEDLGFFEEQKINVEGKSVSPRKLTAKLFERKLSSQDIKDLVVMEVVVDGIKKGERLRLTYRLLDKYDEKKGITAMARTTAYPVSIVAQLMLKGLIKQKGIVPPEKLGMDEKIFKEFISELKKRGVRVTETKETY
jgi:saccharopine dehydrogenase-like NADP-dependent oxidoreductase